VYETLGDVDVDADAVRERRQGNEDESAADDTEVPVDHEATFLEVDGMHCATCEAFIETVATQTEGSAPPARATSRTRCGSTTPTRSPPTTSRRR